MLAPNDITRGDITKRRRQEAMAGFQLSQRSEAHAYESKSQRQEESQDQSESQEKGEGQAEAESEGQGEESQGQKTQKIVHSSHRDRCNRDHGGNGGNRSRLYFCR
jgi:hypothetical protein